MPRPAGWRPLAECREHALARALARRPSRRHDPRRPESGGRPGGPRRPRRAPGRARRPRPHRASPRARRIARSVVVRLRRHVVHRAGLGLVDEGVGETNRLVPLAAPVVGLDQVSFGPANADRLAALPAPRRRLQLELVGASSSPVMTMITARLMSARPCSWTFFARARDLDRPLEVLDPAVVADARARGPDVVQRAGLVAGEAERFGHLERLEPDLDRPLGLGGQHVEPRDLGEDVRLGSGGREVLGELLAPRRGGRRSGSRSPWYQKMFVSRSSASAARSVRPAASSPSRASIGALGEIAPAQPTSRPRSRAA